MIYTLCSRRCHQNHRTSFGIADRSPPSAKPLTFRQLVARQRGSSRKKVFHAATSPDDPIKRSKSVARAREDVYDLPRWALGISNKHGAWIAFGRSCTFSAHHCGEACKINRHRRLAYLVFRPMGQSCLLSDDTRTWWSSQEMPGRTLRPSD